MKRILRWIAGTAVTIAFLAGRLCFFSASLAYEEAGRWFARATYNTECTPTGPPGCADLLLQQPNWPSGVEVRDKDVLLAEASALHNTGSGILSLGGLLMAATGVLLASSIFSGQSIGHGKGGTSCRLKKAVSQLWSSTPCAENHP
ncbi:hypothetical protein Q9R30_15620 [Arthrobacter sp. AB6]|uniref:hypothetical protein n=1 Tax=Arthrobacter sp. AB6 TaxID=2962570 RepID=UPI0028811DDE|nr:hypothetical protein [Arthrobacter sp. AB6]MDT0196783.1 hypothetical protein [Arthrobacter sp. AB6]